MGAIGSQVKDYQWLEWHSDDYDIYIDDITEDWLGGVPIQRLVDPLETAVAVTFLCLPSSGAIRGVSLAVDGGRMRSI